MMKELAERIRSAGYWETVIRPATHVPNRVQPITKLYPLLERHAVQIRGWDYPHLDRRQSAVPGQNSIAQATEWEHYAEMWRFYQSGQFVSLDAMNYDWRDRSGLWPADAKWKRGALLGVLDAFYTLVEMYEFAARLSNTEAGDAVMVIEVSVGGLRGRQVFVDSPRRAGLSWSQVADIDVLRLPVTTLDRGQLVADPVAPAVDAANELFARFGRQFPPDFLRELLNDLR